MTRRLWIPLVLGVAASLGGCNCNTPSEKKSVVITSPTSGTTLTLAADVDAAKDGLQFNVKVTTKGIATGAKSYAKILVGSVVSNQATIADDGTATVVIDAAGFSNDTYSLKAVAGDDTGEATSDKIAITLDVGAVVTDCKAEITAPINNALLTAKDDLDTAKNGVQTDVTIRSTKCGSGAKVRICLQGNGLTGTKCKGNDGIAVAEVAQDASNITKVRTDWVEGVVTVAAEVETASATVHQATPTPVTVRVDSKAPSCTFTSPVDGATLTLQNVDVQLTVADVDEGSKLELKSSLKPEVMPGTLSGTTASVAAILPAGAQTLTATVTDSSGNAGTCSIAVTVNIDGCDVVLTDPPTGEFIFNIANANPTGSPLSGTHTVTGSTTKCAGGKAAFFKKIAGVETQVVVVDVDAQGKFSQSVSFPNGEVDATLRVAVSDPRFADNTGTTVAYFADFTPPTLDSAIPAIGAMNIVSGTNPHVTKIPADPGYYADADSAAGGQVNVTLNVTGAGTIATGSAFGSALKGRVSAAAGVAQAFETAELSDNAQSNVAKVMSLSEGYAGTVVLTITDSANNSITAQWDAKVSTVDLTGLSITKTLSAVNALNDKDGDHATFASIDVSVKYDGTPASGSEVVLCTNPALAGAAVPCATAGFFAVSTTRQSAIADSNSNLEQLLGTVQFPAEGTYQLIAELKDSHGLSVIDSSIFNVKIDTVPPKVVSLLVPADTNNDGTLNKNEWSSGNTIILATFEGVEDGQNATLTDTASGTTLTAMVTGNKATFTLPSTLLDGTYSFVVTVSDAAGNPNIDATITPPIVNSEAQLPLSVKRTLPTIQNSAPAFSVCNLARDADPTSSTTCELDYVVTIVPTEAQQVAFAVSPSGAGTIVGASTVTTFTGDKASARYSLGQSLTTVTLQATVTDDAGNTASTSYDLTLVDTIAPTLTITGPANGTQVGGQLVPFTAQTNSEPGTKVTVTTSADGTKTWSFNVIAGSPNTASGTLSLPFGDQDIFATATDLAGNVSAQAKSSITMDMVGCDVQLTQPSDAQFIFNIANSSPSGAPLQGSFNFVGKTTRCADGTVTFTKTVGGVVTDLGTAVVGATGDFSKTLSFPNDESNAVLNVRVEKTGIAPNSGVDYPYFTDFTAPVLVDAIPALGNLTVVGGTEAVNLTVSGVGTNATAGYGSALHGNVVITGNSQTLLTSAEFTNNGNQTVSGNIVLPILFTGPVTITLKDSAGNTTTGTWNVTVSPTPLPTITIGDPQAGTINIFKDKGGDRSTYALVLGAINFSSAVPANTQLVLCSTIRIGASPSGCGTGYFEIPGTRVTPTGTFQIYPVMQLPQGSQDLIAQLTGPYSTVSTSAPVHVLVDTVPPVVTSIVASDDLNGDGLINGIGLPLGHDVTFKAYITGADGQQATMTGTDSTGGIRTATAQVTSGLATFVFPATPDIPDGLFTTKVTVTDVNGNPNLSTAVSPAITNAAATFQITFQRAQPSISVFAPTSDVCNLSNQKQPPSAGNVCDIDFVVVVGSTASRVDFSLSPSNAGSFPAGSVTTFTNGRATKTFALNQSTTPVTLGARVYDAAGNFRDASWTLNLVDTIAPALTITSPIGNPSVQFSQQFPVTITTDAEVGQTVAVKSSGATVGTGTVVAGSPRTAAISVSLSSTPLLQTLSATVTDLAGNVSVAKTVDVQLNLQGCDVNFLTFNAAPASTNPLFNASSAPGGLVHIVGNTTRSGCSSAQINFTAAINGAAAVSVGSATASGGSFSFDYTFPDGSSVVFEGKSTVSGSSPNSFTAVTDITLPTLAISAPVPNSSNALFVVAKTGNLNVKQAVSGYLADADNTLAGGQVAFNLVATGAGPSAGVGTGTVTIMQGAKTVFTQAIGSNSAQVLSPTVSLDRELRRAHDDHCS
ncbi:MAG: hypothetical protein QM765_24410 [Myxococcales bacterium]